MTDNETLMAELRGWIDRESVPDLVVSGWIVMAETRVNRELRVKEMIQRDTATLVSNEIVVPGDWLQTEYLRYVTTPGSGSPDIRFGRPLKYATNDTFWESCNDPDNSNHLKSFYTSIGGSLLINPNVQAADGTQLEIGYYAKVPPIATNGSNWLFSSYHDLFLYLALSNTGFYLVEDERTPLWQTMATKLIADSNDAWTRAKSSGGPLRKRFISFG